MPTSSCGIPTPSSSWTKAACTSVTSARRTRAGGCADACTRRGPAAASCIVIAETTARHDMTDFTHLIDLASARLGGAAVATNDDFFAEKENLVKPEAPIWIDGKYTDRGKWMDGWESRRRRTPGHDCYIVRLVPPCVTHSFVVDTAFFTGNYPSHCSIDACGLPT